MNPHHVFYTSTERTGNFVVSSSDIFSFQGVSWLVCTTEVPRYPAHKYQHPLSFHLVPIGHVVMIFTSRRIRTVGRIWNLARFLSSKPEIRPFEEIPGPKELPVVGSLVKFLQTKEGYHEFFHNMHQEHGDVVKFSIMGAQAVSVCRPEHIKEVYTTNQSSPLREALEPWVIYRKERNLPLGATLELSQYTQDEEAWRKYRRPISMLLRPELVTSYVKRVSHVASDLADALRMTNSEPVSLTQLRNFTSAYGFEAICAILMGKSMGALVRGEVSDETRKLNRQFMDSVDSLFRISDKMIFKEVPLWRYFHTSSRQELFRSFDEMYGLGGQLFAARDRDRDPRFTDDGVMDFFDIADTESEKLSVAERQVVGTELIGAGVDTTSNAAQWVLLLMAQRPEVQERLAASIRSVMGEHRPGQRISAEQVKELKLHDFVDETLRLHPVLPTGSRLFNKDMELFGYHIPAFTLIKLNNWTASKDSRNFQNPSEFDETRSPRKECPFANKTFGVGARQCTCMCANLTCTKWNE